MVGDHFNRCRGLANTNRYAGSIKLIERNVAGHSFYVCWFSKFLTYWENSKFKLIKVDTLKVYEMALAHDIVECVTGDIKSPVKSLSSTFRDSFKDFEKMVLETVIVKELPCGMQDEFLSTLHEYEQRESYESLIVKSADILDNSLECLEEIRVGNKNYYEDNLRSNIKMLFENGKVLKSVMYFLRYPANELGLSVYYTESQMQELKSMDEFFKDYI